MIAIKTREEILQGYALDSERLLAAKVLDKLIVAEKTWEVVRGDFYDPAEAQLVNRLTSRRNGEAAVSFFGGYDYAERQRACFFRPELTVDAAAFGLTALRIKGNFNFLRVSHRDYLGSLLALGLRREKLGDVVVVESGAFIVVDESIAEYIRTQLKYVGKAEVSVDYSSLKELESYKPHYISDITIAASARLDAVIAAVYKLSRSEAAALVERGFVKLNHIPCTSGAKEVKPGDLVSGRGYGRVYIREFIGFTQKNRLRMRVERPL